MDTRMLLKTAQQRYHGAVRRFPPPAYVAAADEGEIDPPKDAAGAAFADPERRFPVQTKAAAWFSAATLCVENPGLAGDGRRTADRIRAAASYLGNGADVEAVFAKAAGAEDLSNLAAAEFAIVLDDGSRHAPLRDPGEVEKAAADLLRWGRALPYRTRRAAAARVLEKAAAFGVRLDRDAARRLDAASGSVPGSRGPAAAAIRKRAVACRRRAPDAASALYALADAAAGDGDEEFMSNAEAVKLATTIDVLDRELGVHLRDDAPPPIEEETFLVTKTAFAEFAKESIVAGGVLYERAALEKLAAVDLGRLLGDRFAADVSLVDGAVDPDLLKLRLDRDGHAGDAEREAFPKAARELGVAGVRLRS